MYSSRSIEAMVYHACMLRENSPVMYQEMVNVWRKFAKGQDGGEFEPWNPVSVRETYYSGWKDEDFTRALNEVGEHSE